ncbi:hypothetical protein HDV00_006430 [Rhizophlyctis rosea]|nr:hypothetical protein HDV00_006430 [Rhizophlyctis rosea]
MPAANSSTYEKKSSAFRRALKETNRCLIGPGVFDGLSAHVASTVGFDFLYCAGSGGSGSLIGEPDLSVITQTEMVALARTIVQCTTVPVICDADTGFGGPINIKRTIRLLEGAGVAGIHIEDQTFPKRCGQLTGKQVVEIDEFLERIAAAVHARTDPDFVIIARTDAREVAGNIDECIRRLKAAMDVGADVAFTESPRTKEECEKLVKALHPHPVLINVLPNGLTPNLTTKECTELGFKAAIYPCTGFIPAMRAMQKSYTALKEKGTDLDECGGLQIKNFFEQVGLKDDYDFDAKMVDIAKKEITELQKKHAAKPIS